MMSDNAKSRGRMGGRMVALIATVAGVCFVLPFDGLRGPCSAEAVSAAAQKGGRQDEQAAREAFRAAYTVFMHARCMNCHPAGDIPLQGDDSHLHTMGVKRGAYGRGKYALKCANCHQDTNLPGAHMPPGNPNWHLPPSDMRMVFQGKSPGELCRQLKDPKLNGGKTLEQIVEHSTSDELVLWGWNPGEGRTLPPLSQPEFAKKMREWFENGAACPD